MIRYLLLVLLSIPLAGQLLDGNSRITTNIYGDKIAVVVMSSEDQKQLAAAIDKAEKAVAEEKAMKERLVNKYRPEGWVNSSTTFATCYEAPYYVPQWNYTLLIIERRTYNTCGTTQAYVCDGTSTDCVSYR